MQWSAARCSAAQRSAIECSVVECSGAECSLVVGAVQTATKPSRCAHV